MPSFCLVTEMTMRELILSLLHVRKKVREIVLVPAMELDGAKG